MTFQENLKALIVNGPVLREELFCGFPKLCENTKNYKYAYPGSNKVEYEQVS